MSSIRQIVHQDMVRYSKTKMKLGDFINLVKDLNLEVNDKVIFTLRLYDYFGPINQSNKYHELCRSVLILFSYYLSIVRFRKEDLIPKIRQIEKDLDPEKFGDILEKFRKCKVS